MWRILGHEVVLRTVEVPEADDKDGTVEKFIELLTAVGASDSDDDDDTASVATVDTHSPSPQPQTSHSTAPSTIVSPILSRMQSDFQGVGKEKESGMPSVMSLLSSLATGSTSRSQSSQPQTQDETLENPAAIPSPEAPSLPRAVGAVAALVSIFSQLAFTPFVLEKKHLDLAIHAPS